MGSFSVWHWLIVLILIAVPLWPSWRIMKRAGYSGAWALLLFVPLVNLIGMFVFAFAEWPVLQRRLAK